MGFPFLDIFKSLYSHLLETFQLSSCRPLDSMPWMAPFNSDSLSISTFQSLLTTANLRTLEQGAKQQQKSQLLLLPVI